MRHALIGLLLTMATLVTAPANAAVSVSIGINVPAYPTLVEVPGYPVYYAPSLRANYFYYDGMFWVFSGDTWYESSWYNGPWYPVDPIDVPVFLLRVPVRYYHARPAFFRGWAFDAPPRWGEHWGSRWESRRAGWDRWNRGSAPAAAPLPTYQRSYSGSRYPSNTSQQAAIQRNVISAQAGIQSRQDRFTQRQAQVVQQAPQRTERFQQAQPQRAQQFQAQQQQRAQQFQAQQQQRAQQMQARGQERAQQAQAQQRVQQAQAPRQERAQPQHENRGEGRGHDRHDNG